MEKIIVSRHAAAIQFVAEQLGGVVCTSSVEVYRNDVGIIFPSWEECISNTEGEEATVETIPVVAQATEEDVRGKEVFGNLPLHLAACADSVCVVEFKGAAPRGQEYSLEDMKAAGAVLRRYKVAGVYLASLI